MSTRTVEFEDTLTDNVQCAIEEVSELLEQKFKEYPEEDMPDLGELDYDGRVHEIIDSCVPIYTKEIEDTWYLYSDRLEEAYENSGIGDNPRENSGMVAIYCYIEQEVSSWYYDNAEELWEEWQEKYQDDLDDADDD